MYEIFNLLPDVAAGHQYPANWNTVSAGLRRNVETVLRYYRRNPTAVSSDHFIIRLIGAINIPHGLSTIRFFENVDDSLARVSMATGMTSSYSKGRVFRGVFYGQGCDEIIIGHNTWFDPEEAEKDWENLTPIEVLSHPRSDLSLALPDGNDNGSNEDGFAVIAINVPMLAIQYRAFRAREADISNITNDSELSIQHFVRMYPIPNMLFSHLDYALFNRVYYKEMGIPFVKNSFKHSFALPDYTPRVDAIVDTVLTGLHKVNKNFTYILKNIPAVYKESMLDVMVVPDVPPTQQVEWALSVARVDAIKFLLHATNGMAAARNNQELNRIRQDIRQFRSNRVIYSVLPRYQAENIMDELEAIYEYTTA